MESLRIVLLAVVAACLYGILHDQITARISLEYFTVAHEPLINSTSPTLLGLAFGITATWWLGAILGVILACAARLGSWPKLRAPQLIPSIAVLLATMAAAALFYGWMGHALGKADMMTLAEPLASRVPPDRQAPFLAAYFAHNASYSTAAIGGLIVCCVTLWRRTRMKNLPVST